MYQEGSWHTEVLTEVICQYELPRTYIEIGVRTGTSFNTVLPWVAEAHGVDIDEQAGYHMEGGNFYHMSSDEFFEVYEGSLADVIFIDGEHTYEQALTDFYNAIKVLRPDGTIVLHDTFPVIRGNESLCGTVWKLAEELEHNSLYNTYTFRKFPGVTIVQLPLNRWGL